MHACQVPFSDGSSANGSRLYRASLLQTMRDIHAQGVIHGDVRSLNIIVGPDVCTIVDFDRAFLSSSNAEAVEEISQLKHLLV